MKYIFTLNLFLFCFFSISSAQPANDNLCNAIPITIGAACPTNPNIDTDAATAEVNEPIFQSLGFFGDTLVQNSVWYSFVAPANEVFIVASKATPDFNGAFKMALFSLSGDCSDLSNLVPVTNAYAAQNLRTTPTIQATLQAGETYFIQISGGEVGFPPSLFSGQGCLSIEAVSAPDNDDVCNATVLSLDAAPQIFNNLGATAQAGEAAITPPASPFDPAGFNPGAWSLGNNVLDHSVWFSFTTPDSIISVDIDLGASTPLAKSFNSQVAIYEASDCNDFSAFSFVDGRDNAFPPGPGAVLINASLELFCLSPNTTYYIVVDGTDNFFFNPIPDQGEFAIQVRQKVLEPVSIISQLEGPDCAGESNGSILTSAAGGAGGYAYQWSNGDSVPYLVDQIAIDEVFTLTVTDQCNEQFVDSFKLETPLLGVPTLNTPTLLNACLGEEITLMPQATGGLLADTNRLFTEVGGPNGNRRLLSRELLRPGLVNSVNDSTGVFLQEYEFVQEQLYGIGFDNDLYTVSTITGVLTLVDTLDIVVADLSYSKAAGKLYATTDTGVIYEINPTTGEETLVADFGVSVFQGVLYNDDQLFFYNFDSLYNYDITNQKLTALVPAAGAYQTFGILGIELDPSDGTIYVAVSTGISTTTPGFIGIRTLDPTNGSFSNQLVDFSGSGRISGFAIKDRDRLPYNYAWIPAEGLEDTTLATPKVKVSGPASYTLMITDQCGASASTTIDITPFITDTTIIDTTVLVGTNYGSEMIAITADTILYETVVAGGPNGCNSVTLTNITATLTNVLESWPGTAIQLSPNPARNQLFIQTEGIEEREVQYFVRDLYGRILQSTPKQGVRQSLNIDFLVPGQYYLEIRSANKQAVRRFVKY